MTSSRGRSPTWSPNGQKIAFECSRTANGANSDLCTMAPDGSGLKNLTNTAASGNLHLLPDWSDGGDSLHSRPQDIHWSFGPRRDRARRGDRADAPADRRRLRNCSPAGKDIVVWTGSASSRLVVAGSAGPSPATSVVGTGTDASRGSPTLQVQSLSNKARLEGERPRRLPRRPW
ncbi:MAG: PD40 domain-containing protein [Actinobacteria bacterium]|nr:PD40 domain-containing protein [Actinomycetota bacterium]